MFASKKIIYLLLIMGFLWGCSIDEIEPLPPVNIATTPFTPFSIVENPVNGTKLGVIEASATFNRDGSINSKFSFSLTKQNPEGAMAIDEKTGVLTVADGSKFDYELSPVVSALAQIDLQGVVEGVEISISITDQQEISMTGFTASVNENLSNGTSIGSVSVEFEDGTPAFSIVSQSVKGALDINPETGNVFVADSSNMDYETNPQITATAQVICKGEAKTAEIVIDLQDVVEPNPDVDAIAYYKLDGNGLDEKQGEDAVIYGAVPVVGIGDESNTAYEVDIDEYIGIDDPIIDVTQDFSIAIWAKPNQPNPYTVENTIWSNRKDVKDGSEQGGMSLIYMSDGTTEYLRFRAYATINNTLYYVLGEDVEVDFSDKDWHHITVTRSGNDYSIYADAVLLTTFNSTSTTYNGNSWTLGGTPYKYYSNIYTWSYFDGSLDQLRFYQKAISPEKITAMFSYKM